MALCDIFAKMDQTCAGVVRRVDFLSSLREFGTDVEFRKLVRRTALANRFHDTAKDLTLDEFVALTLPRATAAERTLAYRWADLWKLRRTLEIGGCKGDSAELRRLFTILDEASVGSVQLKELVRARLFSHDEVLKLLPRHRGVEPLSFDEFCELVGPELCQKYQCPDHDSINDSSSQLTALISKIRMKTPSIPDASDHESVALAARKANNSPPRPQGLPPLPLSSRQAPPCHRSNSFGERSSSPNSGIPTSTAGALADTSCMEMARSAPLKRFETSRTKNAKHICSGGADDACLRNSDLLKNCSYLFVTFLIDELSCEMFRPGDIIMREDEIGDKIYFLRRGEADVLIGPDLRKVAELREGFAFGEMALFESAGKRSATVRATGLCDCRTLRKTTFMKLLEHFPEDKEVFRKLARQRRGSHTIALAGRPVRRSSSVKTREPNSMATSITPIVTAF